MVSGFPLEACKKLAKARRLAQSQPLASPGGGLGKKRASAPRTALGAPGLTDPPPPRPRSSARDAPLWRLRAARPGAPRAPGPAGGNLAAAARRRVEGGRQVRGGAGRNRAGAKGASPASRALGDGETRGVSPEVAPKTVELAGELNSHLLQLPVLISADFHALENSTALRGAEEVNRCSFLWHTGIFEFAVHELR